MRRLIALLLCTALLVTAAFSASYFPQPYPHYDVRTDLSVHFTNSDAIIAHIRRAMKNRDDTIIINYRSHADNMSDLGAIVRELMAYANAETDDPEEGDYLFQQYGGYEMQYSYRKEADEYCYELRITPDYYSTAAQEDMVRERVQSLIREWDFSRSTDDFEKVQTVCDYVAAHVDYDRIHMKNEHYHLKSTAYGALVNGYALCQGYAVTVYRLLRECGVPCRVITGEAEKPDGTAESHAWNLVCLGGLWYQLDVTWNDQLETDAYFLCGTSDFPKHTPDAAYADAAFFAQYPHAESRYIGG
ncbi:MAG: transglutaminase domain-containing protein [Oscillospiraceae bacterium]|nr:transglutaminase domain-containing protein [Oscillospiraceae bacterium]